MVRKAITREESENTNQGVRGWATELGGYENALWIVKLNDHLLPGTSKQATWLRWDPTAGDQDPLADKGAYIEPREENNEVKEIIFDPLRMNCYLKDEWAPVRSNNATGRYEVDGSFGLIRDAVVVSATIAPGASGTVQIWYQGGANGPNVEAHHNWITESKTLQAGQQLRIQWYRDEGTVDEGKGYPLDRPGLWKVIDSDCNFG